MEKIFLPVLTVAVLNAINRLCCRYKFRQAKHEKELDQATQSAAGILASAEKEAESLKKEKILAAQDETHKYRQEVEAELKDRRHELQKQENRLLQREETIDRKDELFEKKEAQLAQRDEKLNEQQKSVRQKKIKKQTT